MRAIAWNDRAVYDDDTDEDWSRKRVSIVIPARNESKAIGTVLRLVSPRRTRGAEIIVSVGDSSDDTADIARSHGAIVVSGEKGRGNQMNAGARVATGDYILFLHADTPPADVVDVIRRQLRDQKTVIGGFVSLIETPTRTFWGMSYHNVVKTTYCAVISRPFAYLRGLILFGDQAMFVQGMISKTSAVSTEASASWKTPICACECGDEEGANTKGESNSWTESSRRLTDRTSRQL